MLALLSLFFSLWWQDAHYADLMLDALTIALCPELCQHNLSNPAYVPSGLSFYSKGTRHTRKGTDLSPPLLFLEDQRASAWRVNGVKGTKDHFFFKSEIAKFKKLKDREVCWLLCTKNLRFVNNGWEKRKLFGKILSWLRGFLVIFLYLVWFS